MAQQDTNEGLVYWYDFVLDEVQLPRSSSLFMAFFPFILSRIDIDSSTKKNNSALKIKIKAKGVVAET